MEPGGRAAVRDPNGLAVRAERAGVEQGVVPAHHGHKKHLTWDDRKRVNYARFTPPREPLTRDGPVSMARDLCVAGTRLPVNLSHFAVAGWQRDVDDGRPC